MIDDYFKTVATRLGLQFALMDVEEEMLAVRGKINSKQPTLLFGEEQSEIRDLLADDLRRHHTVHMLLVKDAPSDDVIKMAVTYALCVGLFEDMLRMIRRDLRTDFKLSFTAEKVTYKRLNRIPNPNSVGIYVVLSVITRIRN